MRTLSKILLAAGGAAAALAPSAARAQLDINPPLPNVLLLIDTSGSMERMADGALPAETPGAKCTPGTPSVMNRWATLVSVLTGSIENFSCFEQDRSSAAFLDEYSLEGKAPYDRNYALPFHRILSNGCTAGPGAMGSVWGEWPANAIRYHPYSDANAACAEPGFQQGSDGVLDTFSDRVRFGLMTFDASPDSGTGAAGSSLKAASGMGGMWSYFLNWQGGGAPSAGNPPNCPAAVFEVGARNPAAPPWEGQLQAFGAYDAKLEDIRAGNKRVQDALVAMRPFGATPLAGMLADARTFIKEDLSNHPVTGKPFGPAADPFIQGGCRKTFIIVLSDGEPNLDLRSACASGDGKCPYEPPHEIAHELASLPEAQRVQTFAVGFGLSSTAGTDCSLLTQNDLLQPGGKCDGASGSLAACCTLGRVAYEGGSERAYFADDPGTLRAALSQVLAKITKGSTSRTLPVFVPAATVSGGNDTGWASFQFLSSFESPLGGELWRGNLERRRYVCENVAGVLSAELEDIDSSKGDDFVANLNSNDAARPRRFFTVVGDAQGGKIHSSRSIRPSAKVDDGLGLYGGSVTGSGAPAAGPAFASELRTHPLALGMSADAIPQDCASRLGAANVNDCAERIVRWEVGETNLPHTTVTRDVDACAQGASCSEFGSIYHSTPVAVGPPRDFLRDESYATFASTPKVAERPLMLYTATTDGQLHAFKIAANAVKDDFKVDKNENNELWSFLPPHVLPKLLPTYDQQAFLLDGAPVVKDVVFERSTAQAIEGGGSGGAKWSTVLLAGGGAAGGFYYALDVTDPLEPKFLWQLSTDIDGKPLFGETTPTPTIATLQLKTQDGIREVAVAILAGGSAPLRTGACTRQNDKWPGIKPKGSFPPRGAVRCWGEGGGVVGPGRTLSVVRLDTGEVLMSFRGHKNEGPSGLGARAKEVFFDSPLTGVPVAFPSRAGEVSNRVYIGDADGSLWRVDLSSFDPNEWTVDLAWDAYSMNGDTAATSEPIQTAPIVSVDPVGNTVLLFSTGDQEMFTASSGIQTRVWSLLERPDAAQGKFETTENWVIPFENGKRVTGPISLFNSVAYFATYTPTSSGVASCADGFGSIWGVDYLQAEQGAVGPLPLARYADDPEDLTKGYVRDKPQDPGVVVFGVAVAQTPSCSETEAFNDPYFGSHTAVSNVGGGEFQLVYQTGKGGSSSGGAKTNTRTETLARPRESTRIDSWASIVE